MKFTPILAVIDDDYDLRSSLVSYLNIAGYQTIDFETPELALNELDEDFAGIILTDIRTPGMDGMQFLKRMRRLDPGLPVILMTGYGDLTLAVEAMRIGAYDFLTKPLDLDRLKDMLRRAIMARKLVLENRELRRDLSDGSLLRRRLIGDSEAMEWMRIEVLDIAQTDANVLISGEEGTGKSLIARAIHACGSNQGKAFNVVNCANDDEDYIAHTLFGDKDTPGLFSQDVSGTLALDSIEALSVNLQTRLFSKLEEIDENASAPNLRIVSSSIIHPDIPHLLDTLRPELYHRLAVLQVKVPPLRSRGQDVLLLMDRFLNEQAEELGCEAPDISAENAAQLLQMRWDGNVRQLRTLAERAVKMFHRDGTPLGTLLGGRRQSADPATGEVPLKEAVESFERTMIASALKRHSGALVPIIKELSIPRRTLTEKMEKYGLTRDDFA